MIGHLRLRFIHQNSISRISLHWLQYLPSYLRETRGPTGPSGDPWQVSPESHLGLPLPARDRIDVRSVCTSDCGGSPSSSETTTAWPSLSRSSEGSFSSYSGERPLTDSSFCTLSCSSSSTS